MKAAQLHQLYSFQKRSDVPDGAGNTKSDWVEQFQCRGARKFFKGREKVVGAAETSTQEVIITVRKSTNTVLVNGAWRVVDVRSGETYNVRIVEPQGNRQYLDVLVQSGVADG